MHAGNRAQLGLDTDAMLGAVLADLDAGLAFLDTELRFVRINPVLAEMNGLPVAAHLGRTPMELLPELDPATYIPYVERALAGEPSDEVEVVGSTKARHQRVWMESFHPVCRDAGVVGVMVLARDVTEERAAVAAAARSAARLAQLQGIGDAGLTQRPLEELLDDVVERTRLLLDGDTATLLLGEEQFGTLRVRGAAGLTEEVRGGVAVPVGRGVAGRVAASGRPLIVDDLDAVEVVSPYLRTYGLKSLVATPLKVDDVTIGVLHVGSRRRAAFDEEDLSLLSAAASRAALVIDRAVAYDQQRVVAETLQHSLLPGRLPDLPEVKLAARYRPSGAGLAVGGDWYDAQPLPDGRLALVIGDVVGHGVQAAALMGQLRTALRAHLSDGQQPSAVLHRLNDLVSTAGLETIATAVVGLLDPADGALTLAVAGHPPPLLRQPDGTVTVLDQHPGPVLGMDDGAWPEQTVRMPPGGALLLYTDGLVERRTEDVDRGIRAAADALAGCVDPDSCVAALAPDPQQGQRQSFTDDVAVLLAVRPVDQVDRLSLSTDGAADFSWLRRQVRDWLQRAGATAGETDEVVLAVTEALTEAVGAERGQPVELTMSQAGNRISAQVRAGSTPPPPADTDRGRALVLMEALSDLLVLDTQQGIELRLTRAIGGAEPPGPSETA